MELRRALLLFAVVLGLAAIVASLARPVRPTERPADSRDRPAQPAPTTGPPKLSARPSGSPAKPLRFRAGHGKTTTRRLAVGDAGVVSAAVPGPGQVEIPGLGLSASADELTPARIDVFGDEAGSYPLRFVPSDGARRTRIGRLEIVSSDAS